MSNLCYISSTFRESYGQANEWAYPSGGKIKYKSAYGAFHSTTMALLKIHNDKSTTAGLVLPDLSAAFDTVDHFVLFALRTGMELILL